jgi:hypothetical protein
MVRNDPRMKDVVGERDDGDPDELKHWALCPVCQQAVDRRDLAAVLHHNQARHEPLPAEDAERLQRISEQLKAALERRP